MVTQRDKSVWTFIIMLTLSVLIPGLFISARFGWDIGHYPVVASLSWLVGAGMTWGYNKFKEFNLST